MLENIIGGLIVAALLAIAGWLYRKRFLARIAVLQMLYGEILAVFNNAEKASPDIEREALHSKTIRYLGAYNTTFLRERALKDTLLYKILAENKIRRQAPLTIRFLHLDPSSRFIILRGKELKYPRNGQEIRDGVRASLTNVELITSMLDIPEGTVEVRHYDFQAIFRLILLDKCAYIGFYKIGRMGRESPVLKVSEGSELYQALGRFFEVIWEYFSKPSENTGAE